MFLEHTLHEPNTKFFFFILRAAKQRVENLAYPQLTHPNYATTIQYGDIMIAKKDNVRDVFQRFTPLGLIKLISYYAFSFNKAPFQKII